ncbi:helix-turn-helix domain-containing protein [Lactococcus protaetiae]|uniref:Uncharacterized protein n=1 Tax=Lactococcus protaetiae TaxID=2592653 RepID=A0A514Z8M2_9LACT|nr:helix-turn-helix transcriptional regulator [Lactococcus protaetiae]MCL2113381.1 helix-turn-helix domain-containing protein [Streptococcaceae bacterium]QDK70867.1 hypothetical protein FLP15_06520 [Lactococcus protaetiae]
MTLNTKTIKKRLIQQKMGIIPFAQAIGVLPINLSDYLFRGKPMTDLEMNKLVNYFEKEESATMLPKISGNADTLSLSLGEKIKMIREKRRLLPSDFVVLLSPEIPESLFLKWEENREIPVVSYCVQIADLGGVSLDWLLRN